MARWHVPTPAELTAESGWSWPPSLPKAGDLACGLAIEGIEFGRGVDELVLVGEGEPGDLGYFCGDACRGELARKRIPIEGKDAVWCAGSDEDAAVTGSGSARFGVGRCGDERRTSGKGGGGGGNDESATREIFHGREIVAYCSWYAPVGYCPEGAQFWSLKMTLMVVSTSTGSPFNR